MGLGKWPTGHQPYRPLNVPYTSDDFDDGSIHSLSLLQYESCSFPFFIGRSPSPSVIASLGSCKLFHGVLRTSFADETTIKDTVFEANKCN